MEIDLLAWHYLSHTNNPDVSIRPDHHESGRLVEKTLRSGFSTIKSE